MRSSAKVYEFSTETLFFGRQDAMQRTTLVPISEYVASRAGATPSSEMRLLEIACGTGRLHTYIKVGGARAAGRGPPSGPRQNGLCLTHGRGEQHW